jgi:hypothetical protein
LFFLHSLPLQVQQHSILSPHLHCGAESYQIDNTTIEIISLKHVPTYQK